MKWLVTGTCLSPVVYSHRITVEAGNPEHAVMVARATRHWLPGTKFAVRPADEVSYSGVLA